MKIHATKYSDYLDNYDSNTLQKKTSELLNNLSNKLHEQSNYIIYGPPGTGKYTLALSHIRKYSDTNLQYEKKICVNENDKEYFIKISDIHYEIDFGLLGCNSKTLWNDIYKNIEDIIISKKNRSGIILCKNFHNISIDLLDIFFSYMQTSLITNLCIKFIILSEGVSFIPDNILDRCQIINIKRPSRSSYNLCSQQKLQRDVDLSEITNIKMIQLSPKLDVSPHKIICNDIIKNILEHRQTSISKLRDNLYNILIYNLDIYDCVWYIITELFSKTNITNENISDIVIQTYKFFLHFNNNYRPIYHLENFIIYIINHIYEYGDSM